jgi:hypothetical protein
VLITCGLAALVGTGIFAVLDHSNGVARSSNAPGASAPPATGEADRRPVPAAPTPGTHRAPPARMLTAQPAEEAAYVNANAPASPPAPFAATAYAPAATATSAPISVEEPATTGTFTAPRSSPPMPAAQPAPAPQPAPAEAARMSAKPQPAASANCPLPALNDVLADVSAKFGTVTVVATHQHKTVNHIAGSAREKLHHDCKAVDFRPERSRIEEIKAYLRGRPEIAGVESYRDGVIHMDAAGRALASPGRRRAPASARAQPARDAVEAGL